MDRRSGAVASAKSQRFLDQPEQQDIHSIVQAVALAPLFVVAARVVAVEVLSVEAQFIKPGASAVLVEVSSQAAQPLEEDLEEPLVAAGLLLLIARAQVAQAVSRWVGAGEGVA